MLQRSARLQYLLLALVAFFALTHFILGTRQNFNTQKNGTLLARSPFFNGFRGNAIGNALPEAKDAGLQVGDVILTVNQRSYTGTDVLVQELRRSLPNQTMTFGYLRPDEYLRLDEVPPHTATVVLRPLHDKPTPLWAWVVWFVVTIVSFFCLVTGLYVVFARPLNPHAWLILGILAYFTSLFTSVYYLVGPLKPIALIWSVTAQTVMPLCLMAFGIYFPERAKADIRYPWVKWLFITPMLLLLPIDLLQEFGRPYNFALCNWTVPYAVGINTIETIVGFLAISYFFICLAPKIKTATGDARRRLRILYVGTSVGLTPFFILAVIALFRKTDVGQDIPQWIVLTAVGILFLFPLSLAYVVVVQRAMDLKILIRQGTRYAFARRSVFILQALLSIWLGYALVRFFRHGSAHRTVDIVRIFGVMAFVFSFRFISKRLQQKIDQRFFREAYSSEQILSELSEEARNFTEVTPLLNTITQRIGDTLHIERIAVFLRSGDGYRLQLATGIPVPPMMSPALGSFTLAATSTTITTLARGRTPANVYRDDPSSWLVDAPEAERAALNDLSTELLVPLPGRNRLAGVIALGPKLSEEPYSRTDRQLLQSVATQTGLALENAELFEHLSTEIAHRERVSREIEIAREVQERLFPQVYPQIDSVDLAGYCRPAQVVGGDYYDFFLLPNGSSDYQGERLALALGDISGKGISAALLMASLRASLRSAAQLQPGDLTTLMRHVNRLVYESSTSNRYATFFYAEYDPSTRILAYVNAGHNAPVILRGNERISLEATGTVIGLLPDVCYTRANVVLRPSDILIAFTDGISEAMNSAEEEWGEDSMVAAARARVEQPACTAEQLLNSILAAADRFTAGSPQHDDMTLLICMVR